jgi:hypothetical protein
MLMLEFAFLLHSVHKHMFEPFILFAVFAGLLLCLCFLIMGQLELLMSDHVFSFSFN